MIGVGAAALIAAAVFAGLETMAVGNLTTDGCTLMGSSSAICPSGAMGAGSDQATFYNRFLTDVFLGCGRGRRGGGRDRVGRYNPPTGTRVNSSALTLARRADQWRRHGGNGRGAMSTKRNALRCGAAIVCALSTDACRCGRDLL